MPAHANPPTAKRTQGSAAPTPELGADYMAPVRGAVYVEGTHGTAESSTDMYYSEIPDGEVGLPEDGSSPTSQHVQPPPLRLQLRQTPGSGRHDTRRRHEDGGRTKARRTESSSNGVDNQ